MSDWWCCFSNHAARCATSQAWAAWQSVTAAARLGTGQYLSGYFFHYLTQPQWVASLRPTPSPIWSYHMEWPPPDSRRHPLYLGSSWLSDFIYLHLEIFFIWFEWYQFYVDHLSSSEVMICLIFNFLPQFAKKMQIKEILRFKVPPGSYFAYNLSNI